MWQNKNFGYFFYFVECTEKHRTQLLLTMKLNWEYQKKKIKKN